MILSLSCQGVLEYFLIFLNGVSESVVLSLEPIYFLFDGNNVLLCMQVVDLELLQTVLQEKQLFGLLFRLLICQ